MGKRFLRVFVLLFFILGTSVLNAAPSEILTILHTSDTHSALFPLGPQDKLGGIARMSTLIKKLRAKNENVLAFHSGDVSVGSFEFNKYLGYPEFKIMEGLYDAVELGNHEFDLGLEVLTGVLTGILPGKEPVNLPILCANIDEIKLNTDFAYQPYGPYLASIIEPWMIKEIGGLKVGIFGLVTTEPQHYSELVLGVLTDPFAAAAAQVTELRTNQGCHVVICLSHLGTMMDELYLATIPGIDIILGGHSHDTFEVPVIIGSTVIVEGGEYGLFLGELKVQVNGGNGNGTGGVEVLEYKPHRVDWRIRKDPRLLQPLAMLKVGIVQDPRFGPVYTKKVAKALWDIEGKWDPSLQFRDTPLGNLVTDAYVAGLRKAEFEVDAALEATGYIAHKIYKGKVVGNDIMRVVPYGYDPATGLGFKVVIAELTGSQLYLGLEYTVAYIEYATDYLMQTSGMVYSYDSSQPSGSRIDPGSILINGEPLDLSKNYKIALNENVFSILKSLLELWGYTIPDPENTNLFVYNLVRDYARKINHLTHISEGRILDTAE